MRKSFLLLLMLSLLGCESAEQKAQRLDAERQAQVQKAEAEREVQAQKTQAERQAQAAEAARKLREELGDEIDAYVSHWSKGGDYIFGFAPPGPAAPERNEQVEEIFGFRIENLKMFIKRSTGTLTIIFDCHFLGQKHGFLQNSGFMIRLFDENGEYLTRFSTSDVFALPNTEDTQGRPFITLKAKSNILQYRVSRRYADYAQGAKFGIIAF